MGQMHWTVVNRPAHHAELTVLVHIAVSVVISWVTGRFQDPYAVAPGFTQDVDRFTGTHDT